MKNKLKTYNTNFKNKITHTNFATKGAQKAINTSYILWRLPSGMCKEFILISYNNLYILLRDYVF